MPDLNSDFPVLECYARAEFFHQMDRSWEGKFENVVVFGVTSIPGRALGFHVLSDWGGVWWRLPIHALCTDKDAPRRSLSALEPWNSFSSKFSVHAFDVLSESRSVCRVGNDSLDGSYLTTIDWWGSDYANNAGSFGHKAAHIIILDEGNVAALPGNFLRWKNKAWVTNKVPDGNDMWLLNRHTWNSETDGVTEDSERWDYAVNSDGPVSDGDEDPVGIVKCKSSEIQ